MNSIRRFLVIILLSIMALASFIAALRGYQNSMQEAERLFNQRLIQQADLLNYNLPAWLPAVVAPQPRLLPSRYSEVSSLQLQILTNKGALLARSAMMPDQPLVPLRAGFDSANVQGYRWHLLVTPSVDQEYWFILAERDDQRYRMAESLILEAVYPMVLMLPFVGLMLWWALGIGLRPIALLAVELGKREASDLHPVNSQGFPQELRQLSQSANQLLRRLEASFAREKRFSGDAAHELRTPIAALMLHTDNLLLEHRSESALKIQQGIERMGHLVEQILALNRTAPDQFMGQFEPINLTRLVKEGIAEQSLALQRKSHGIEFYGDPCWIDGDRLALMTLFNNLLSNAIKYTPDGGTLQVATRLEPQAVLLELTDDGPGIEAAYRERVFDRFYRLQRDLAASSGCGLGLSIVWQVVELHRAQIALSTPESGKGLSVQIRFTQSRPEGDPECA